MYSGDYFQMLQSQREAEALQQTAKLGARWAPTQIGGQGMMGLGMAAAMAATGPIGWGIAGVGLIGGAALNMWGSHGQTKGQATIDAETARILAGTRTGQRMQSSTMSIMSMARGMVPYGLSSEQQINYVRNLGKTSGFGAQESVAQTLAFLTAGGGLSMTEFPSAGFRGKVRGPSRDWAGQSPLAERLFELQRLQGISSETLGGYAKGFLPGGGYSIPNPRMTAPAFASSYGIDSLVGTAGFLGIGAARRNEFIQRASAFGQRYAERGVEMPFDTFSGIAGSFNPNLKGMTTTAAAENIQDFGVGLGDQLTESMMPKRLASAMMMMRVIGEGGGPSEWSKKFYDASYMRGQAAETGKIVPDMLRPFFGAQVSGLIPEKADLGVYQNVIPKPAKEESEAAKQLLEAAQKQAAADNVTVRAWYEAVQTATEQLNALTTAVSNAIFEFDPNAQSMAK